MTYADQLKSPMWQKKRLEIFERDKFSCQICGDKDSQLQVHHKKYDKTFKTLAWEYPNYNYQTLCCDCHKALTEHIDEHDTDKEFDVMKIKRGDLPPKVIVYSKGILRFSVDPGTENLYITENTTHDIVQFLINNWLKNG